jgi:hypothetical protein
VASSFSALIPSEGIYKIKRGLELEEDLPTLTLDQLSYL